MKHQVRQGRKAVCILLLLCMIFSVFPGSAVPVHAQNDSIYTLIRLTGSNGRYYNTMLYRSGTQSLMISDRKCTIDSSNANYYSTVTVTDSDGTVQYTKVYKGKTSLQANRSYLRLNEGDLININTTYTRGVFFTDYYTASNINALNMDDDESSATYEVTGDGLKKTEAPVKDNSAPRKAVIVSSVGINFADNNNLRVMKRLCDQNYFGGKSIAYTAMSDPTKAQFESTLNTMFAGSTEDSVNYLIFSCHGLVDRVYLCSDGYYTSHELRTKLDRLPGKFVILIDSCYSGSFVQAAGHNGDDAINDVPMAPVADSEDTSAQTDKIAQADTSETIDPNKEEDFLWNFVSEFMPSTELSGEFANTNKYNVICASGNSNSSYFNIMSYGTEKFCESASWDFTGVSGSTKKTWLGDLNRDGNVTFAELATAFKAMIPWTSLSYVAEPDLIAFKKTGSAPFQYQIVCDGFYAGSYDPQPMVYMDYDQKKGVLHYDSGMGPVNFSYIGGICLALVIRDANGTTKLSKYYSGRTLYMPESQDVKLAVGDTISISTPTPTRVHFNDTVNGIEKTVLQPSIGGSTYKVTATGFVKQ